MLQDMSFASSAKTEAWTRLTADQKWSIPQDEVEAAQLEAAQQRFESLIEKLPVLRKLAVEQGVDRIRDLSDVAKLLLRHNVYKSYPMSALEKGDFPRLTRWLDGLTAVDLSTLDASACRGIDEWIELLDRNTPIRVLHSSGTTGKLSFLPRTEREFADLHLEVFRHNFEGFGAEGENQSYGVDRLPHINCGYASGALAQQRQFMHMQKFWYADADVPTVSLYPERMSADALSLGGRISASETRGELGTLQLSPYMLQRRDEFLQQAREAPSRLDAFFDAIAPYRGQRVVLICLDVQAFDLAQHAQARGLQGAMFAPDSIISSGGGTKGRTLPADYPDQLNAFFGRKVRKGYGMSEIVGSSASRACDHGRYHLLPWIIPYLLDPKTGEILPRQGTQTGRFGLFDTLPSTYWGGFLTGDEVTITWDEPCACGRAGHWMHTDIRRYSQSEGGDDKVTCAGAPEAQDKAIQFLIDMAG